MNLLEKSAILTGGSAESRARVIESAKAALVRAKSCKVYTLPPYLKDHSRLLKAAQQVFPILSPLGLDKRQMSLDQLNDMLFDWIPTARPSTG